jgi:hypothetical protein
MADDRVIHKTKEWYKAEALVRSWLKLRGVDTYQAGFHAPFDCYTHAGTRIDIKNSPFKETREGYWQWTFSIHHPRGRNHDVDAYILRCVPDESLYKLGFKDPILVILPAPIDAIGLGISPRQLLTQYAPAIEDVGLIHELDAAQSERALKRAQEQARRTITYYKRLLARKRKGSEGISIQRYRENFFKQYGRYPGDARQNYETTRTNWEKSKSKKFTK